jgi:type II secretory pathway pseudopilin PulG
MQEKQVAGFFLEIFIVVAILGTLSAIAIPRVGQMIHKAGVTTQESELQNIQTAVIEMMYDSNTGTLEPVGPTADMSEVRTSDMPPLVLKDYLLGQHSGLLKSGCTYTFTADGNVTQILP